MSNIFYIGWGTGTYTAQATDLALSNPYGSVISGTSGVTTTNTTGDTFICTGTLTTSGAVTISEVGLFGSQLSPAVGSLSNQVNPTDTTITISGYSKFSTSFPFNVQVSSEVMTVLSGNGSNVFYVTRAANGSSKSTSIIPALTPVVAPSGNMFMKSTFSGMTLQSGDSMLFNIQIQFV